MGKWQQAREEPRASVSLSLCLSVSLSLCLPVYLSICLSVSPSLCLSRTRALNSPALKKEA